MLNKMKILNKILIFLFIFLIIYHLFYELNLKEGLSLNNNFSNPIPIPTPDTPASVIFSQAAINPPGLQQKLMGNPYSYSDYINTPTSMGMSSAGTVDALGKDIAGIKSYIDVLVSGTGNASKTGTSLGNQFFFNTGGKCMDTVSKTLVPRSIYINNIPQGGSSFLTDTVGTNSSSSQGLIPGIMTNLNALNPFSIMGAFMAGATPDCQQVTLQTVDSYNNKSTETHYITTLDSENIDPCSFTSKINPYTKIPCATISNISAPNKKEGFAPMMDSSSLISDYCLNVREDTFTQIYFSSLGLVGIYILYCLMMKK